MLKKNKVIVSIDNCFNCPNAVAKFDEVEVKHYMYCQTSTSCVCLGDCYGSRPIPDWCPRLKRNKSLRGLHAKILRIIDKVILEENENDYSNA